MADFRYDQDVKSPAKSAATDEFEVQDGVQAHVPAKWRGTEEDRLQMKVMGRLQETRRNFTFISMLGFGSTLMVTWEVILANLGSVLTNGGTAGLFWGFLIVVSGYTLVYASLAEMASMVSPSNMSSVRGDLTNMRLFP